MNHSWKHQYFEKNSKELHTNIFKSLEIEQYFQKTLDDQGFRLQNYKFNLSNSVLNVFLSVCKVRHLTLKNKNEIRSEKKTDDRKKLIIKMKSYNKHKSIENLSMKVKYLQTLRLYKNHTLKLEFDKSKNLTLNTLSKKMLESLKIFTNNKFNIILTMKEINSINSNSNTRQALKTLHKFERASFFSEGKKTLTPLVTHQNSAELLSQYIAAQLRGIKRQNFFFNFLKESLNSIMNQQFSKVQGIKILVKGRINNAARSRSLQINLGKVSLISMNSKISYSESTAFTSNGTLGIKVWISETN